MKKYHTIRVAVYILFEKDDKLLLSKRQNTGYKDGFYSFVQGHVEAGESVTEAAIREAKEEVGVDIDPSNLEFLVVGYNRVDEHYVDFLFRCRNWHGETTNCEPDKCEELKWFAFDEIPENSIFQVKEYIKRYQKGEKLIELS